MIGFGLQIYADFWGYTLIAQGAAMCLGIELMDNFKTPYLSRSISEFWKRWHISLSTWFRDYLYIPLGGNKVPIARWSVNIFIVFVLSGFWHGANYTFLVWGAIHGLIYLLERIAGRYIRWSDAVLPFWRVIAALKTFVVVTLAWVFFRIEKIGDADVLFTSLFKGGGHTSLSVAPVIGIMFLFFIVADLFLYNKRVDSVLEKWSVPVRWSLYAVLIFAILSFGGHINHPFIYFQF